MLRIPLRAFRTSIRQVSFLLIALLTSSAVNANSEKFRLVWDADPAHQAIIGWNQSTGSTSPVFQYRLRGASTWTPAASTTTDYNNPNHGSASDRSAHLISYFVKLTGLTANADYEYQVNDSEGAGTLYWFRTAPDSPSEFTYIAGGDSRSNDRPRQHGMALVGKIRPLFILYNGDFMDDGTFSEWNQWLDEWQATISSDGRIYPILPTHGNHENDVTDMVSKIFGIANPDAYFTTGIGGGMMRIYTLNSELEPGVGYGAFNGQSAVKWDAQTTWFANELVNPANDATWKIANYHRPMRPHTSGKAEGEGRIAAWAQPMFTNGIDLAVESDTHMVKYTYPVEPSTGPDSFESFVRNDEQGIMFIGEGSWGAPTRPVDDDKPWTMDSDSFWQFKLIHASPSSMDIRTVFFGSTEDEAAGIIFDPDSVTELTQAEQDSDAFSMASGLKLWNSLAGDVITLRDRGSADRFDADINSETLVGTGSDWKYLDDGTDLGTAWQATGFNDASWSVGNAQLGYGDGDEATVIGFGADSANKHITSYFRKTINVVDASKLIKLKLRLLRDDGAVIYINGTEVARSNMPEGTILASTLANSSMGGAEENRYVVFSVLPELLVSGSNSIAVEIHQATVNSSDLSFDMDLTATVSDIADVVPATPSDLQAATATSNRIDLVWADNATNEVNYELQQRIGTGEWKIIADRLWTNTSGYVVENLIEGQEYSFRVRAYNAAGQSAYSNVLVQGTVVNPTPIIFSENFGDTCTRFDENFTTFTQVSVGSTDRNWHFYDFSGECFARANGYGGDEPADDWLISKALPLDFYSEETLTFDLAKGFSDSISGLEVLVSVDYDPAVHSDPSTATWINAGATLPPQNDFTFFPASIDLAGLGVDNASKVYVAFHYTSSGTSGGQAASWEVDNFELRGKFTPPEIVSEDFEAGLGSFVPADLGSAAGWEIETRASQTGAFMNGYGSDAASEDWLVSALFTVASEDFAVMSFDYYHKYGGPVLEVYASENCTAPVDPAAITWTQLAVDFSGATDQWNDSGKIDISSFVGSHVCVAFKYQSTGTGGGDGRRWGIDNFKVEKSLGILTVDFSASTITTIPNEPVSFSSFITGGTDLVINWLFGDGNGSTVASPSHAYTTPGQYTVELNVADVSGKTGSKTRTNYIVVQSADQLPVRDANAQLRIATFNILFAHASPAGQGQLISDLSNPNFAQAKAVAEIIQRVRPDVLLLNEFDFDTLGPNASSEALRLFKTNFLQVSQNGATPISFGFDFVGPTNTGVQPEDELNDPAVDFDFSNSGGTDDPEDAFGFGHYPGAFGMAVLSKYEIDTAHIRTFRKLLWKDMPGALLPADPNDSDGNGDLTSWYTADELNVFRVSSKTHLDIPVLVNGTVVHVLGSHPTPPVFDGAEDRNGTRNHDEIRLWADYVTPGQEGYIYDDNNGTGGIGHAQRFVMMGDQNADPVDGDSTNNAILQVLNNNQFDTSFSPRSVGSGIESDDTTDTADFGLRADYVLPSAFGLNIEMNNCNVNDPKLSCGIFWPNTTDVLYRLVKGNLSSDHRMVWLDLSLDLPANDADGDGVGDDIDNCINVANPYQRDTDADNYGNSCDADLNNDGMVNGRDFAFFRADLGKTGTNLDSDLNGDGVVNGGDFSLLRSLLRKQPGPSGLNP